MKRSFFAEPTLSLWVTLTSIPGLHSVRLDLPNWDLLGRNHQDQNYAKNIVCNQLCQFDNTQIIIYSSRQYDSSVIGELRVYDFARNNITNIVGCNNWCRELVRVSKKVF